MKNMTALMSCFARYHHSEIKGEKIYDDKFAKNILSENEREEIQKSLKNGISFFNPNYKGDNPVGWIMCNQLAPSVLARSAFCERHLMNEIKLSLKQYVVLASGYDTSGYGLEKEVKVYELDKKEMIEDKLKRVKSAGIKCNNVSYIPCELNEEWIENLISSGFDKEQKTLCSLMGISYYLDKDAFYRTLYLLAGVMCKGSGIIFDYPNGIETAVEKKNKELANGADEKMKSVYSLDDLQKIAEQCGLLIYENAVSENINSDYFQKYNNANPNAKMSAPKGVSYCLMVKE